MPVQPIKLIVEGDLWDAWTGKGTWHQTGNEEGGGAKLESAVYQGTEAEKSSGHAPSYGRGLRSDFNSFLEEWPDCGARNLGVEFPVRR